MLGWVWHFKGSKIRITLDMTTHEISIHIYLFFFRFNSLVKVVVTSILWVLSATFELWSKNIYSSVTVVVALMIKSLSLGSSYVPVLCHLNHPSTPALAVLDSNDCHVGSNFLFFEAICQCPCGRHDRPSSTNYVYKHVIQQSL